jgi:hypothetical protein
MARHVCSSACLEELAAPYTFRCRETFKIHHCGSNCTSWVLGEDGRVCTLTGRVIGTLDLVHQHTGGVTLTLTLILALILTLTLRFLICGAGKCTMAIVFRRSASQRNTR